MSRIPRLPQPLWLALLLALSLSAGPATAHEDSSAGPATSHEGSSEARPGLPRASLSAEASTEVAQDTVQVTLAAEVSGATQAEVSQALNARLDAVMKQAKGQAGIEARSGGYRIWPMNDRDGRISEWRGQAEILLESRDFSAASRLAAQLNDHMPIAGLAFSVSHQRRAAEEQQLLTQAVDAFRLRAQALTRALGYADYRLRSIELGGAGALPTAPAPRMLGAMMADKTAAPIEGGRERLSVSVQGTIVLLPTGTAPAR